jgi:hypothetical protein
VHDGVAHANSRATGRWARRGLAHHRHVVVRDVDEHSDAACIADEFAFGHDPTLLGALPGVPTFITSMPEKREVLPQARVHGGRGAWGFADESRVGLVAPTRSTFATSATLLSVHHPHGRAGATLRPRRAGSEHVRKLTLHGRSRGPIRCADVRRHTRRRQNAAKAASGPRTAAYGRATGNVVRERTEVRGVIGALTSEDAGRSSTCGAHEPAAA